MKNMRRLFMNSRRFYLGVFLIVLLFTLVDTIYIWQDNDVIFLKEHMESFVQQRLEKDNGVARLEREYVGLHEAVREKGAGETVVSYWVTMAGIILLLVSKEIAYSDVRTQEFRLTWPVKKWVRELHDYLAMLAVVVMGFLTQLLLLLLGQTRHNQLVVQVLQQQGITSKVQDVMAQQNALLVHIMFCYILMMVVSYTWVYLGMSVTKNAVAGVFLSIVVKFGVYWFSYELLYGVVKDVVLKLTSCEYEVAENIGWFASTISTYFLSFVDFFWQYQYSMESGMIDSWWIGTTEYSFTVQHWVIGELILLLVLMIGIILSARKKELSKGKLLYFPLLDYPFVVLMGCAVFGLLNESLLYDSVEIALIVGVIFTIVVFVLIHPISVKKSQRLEVK